jgi:hypothetical protein
MTFPFFQKYSDMLGFDLTSEEYDEKTNKVDLKIKREEAIAVYEQTG